MNTSPAVSVQGVSKRFMLYAKPQERLKHSLFRHFGKRYGREFWALRDISFELRRGETLGIIGRNGSGKSTLLQIIAGTLMATEGEIRVNGPVGALLELGSGFNPEYTGRENIFMNGAIMGIPREEMKARFEEIVAFADIGEFIEQPVKVYSSGMFVRLAFAVTTGIDAQVLLIDEALAVGDVFFRQKCYQRLENLRGKGASIVVVSHSMPDIEQFCERALLLHQGCLVLAAKASEVVKKYYLIEQAERLGVPLPQGDGSIPECSPEKREGPGAPYFWPPPEAFLEISRVRQASNGWARCTGVSLCDVRGNPCAVFQQGERAVFFYEFEIQRDFQVPIGGLEFQDEKGNIVHGQSTLLFGTEVPSRVLRGSRLRFRQEMVLKVAPGEYTFNVGMAAMGLEDYNMRGQMSHMDLDRKIIKVCLLAGVGHFAIGFRTNGKPVQLTHYGMADLPGQFRLHVEPPS